MSAYGIASPLLNNQTGVSQLLFNQVYVSIGPVNFIDGHDDGYFGSPGVVYRFDSLGHYTIVSGYHQNGDIGYIGSVSPHSGKGFMPGGVQEGNLLPVDCYLVGADVLGDASGFGIHYISLPDGIK